MGRLTGLQELDLSSCSGLTALPESMGRLTGLQELDLSSCSGLTALPESMGRLTGLQKLSLSSWGIEAVVTAMGRHAENAKLQEEACRALGNLRINDENQAKIGAQVENIHEYI
jgi:Leucine-rich repeat (LRR) protein